MNELFDGIRISRSYIYIEINDTRQMASDLYSRNWAPVAPNESFGFGISFWIRGWSPKPPIPLSLSLAQRPKRKQDEPRVWLIPNGSAAHDTDGFPMGDVCNAGRGIWRARLLCYEL